jgi:hypothetical protein
MRQCGRVRVRCWRRCGSAGRAARQGRLQRSVRAVARGRTRAWHRHTAAILNDFATGRRGRAALPRAAVQPGARRRLQRRRRARARAAQRAAWRAARQRRRTHCARRRRSDAHAHLHSRLGSVQHTVVRFSDAAGGGRAGSCALPSWRSLLHQLATSAAAPRPRRLRRSAPCWHAACCRSASRRRCCAARRCRAGVPRASRAAPLVRHRGVACLRRTAVR